MRCILVLMMLVLPAVPGGVAVPVFDGTEQEPELRDQEGDVNYHPTSSVQRNHEWLDVAAVWLEYREERDAFVMTLKVADATGLESPPPGWTIYCETVLDFAVSDTIAGALVYRWDISPNSSEISSRVRWQPEGRSVTVDHGFESRLEQPGYFVFTVPRAAVQQFGETVKNIRVTCFDVQFLVATGFPNSDEAAAAPGLDITWYRPASTGEGEAVPSSTVSSNLSTEGSGNTAGVAFVAGLTVLVGVAALRRK